MINSTARNGLVDKLPKHDIDPSVYLNRTMIPNGFMFRGICQTEVYDKNNEFESRQVGIRYSKKMHKIRSKPCRIYEALSMVFNQSLL